MIKEIRNERNNNKSSLCGQYIRVTASSGKLSLAKTLRKKSKKGATDSLTSGILMITYFKQR